MRAGGVGVTVTVHPTKGRSAMSAATDELPAEPVEPEEQEGEDVTPPEDDDDATAATAAQQDGSQGLIEKAERANRNYTKRLREIFGKDVTLYDCAHCDGLGVTFEPEGDALAPADFVTADFYAPCETCAAWGVVLTGSKQPGQDKAPCKKCAGRGFIDVIAAPAAVVPLAPPAAPTDQPVGGQWVPGRGFIPYGQTEPLPNTAGLA